MSPPTVLIEIIAFVDGFTTGAMPIPALNNERELALAVVFTLTLPVPPLNVTFPPACANITPSLVIVTLPVGALTDIAVPAIALSTVLVDPGTSTLTFKIAALAIPAPVKSIELAVLVNSVPLKSMATVLGAGPGKDHIPSPLKKVLEVLVPVADKLADIVPAAVIGPPVTLIYVEEAVDIEVTVPIPSDAMIVFTTSLTK